MKLTISLLRLLFSIILANSFNTEKTFDVIAYFESLSVAVAAHEEIDGAIQMSSKKIYLFKFEKR